MLKTVAIAPEDVEIRKVALEGLGDAYYANCMFEKAAQTCGELADPNNWQSETSSLQKSDGSNLAQRMEPCNPDGGSEEG